MGMNTTNQGEERMNVNGTEIEVGKRYNGGDLWEVLEIISQEVEGGTLIAKVKRAGKRARKVYTAYLQPSTTYGVWVDPLPYGIQ